jgi:hypothetical protein
MSAVRKISIAAADVTLPANSMWRKVPFIAAAIGLAGIGGTLAVGGDHHENYYAYLTAFMFYLSIALGGLFFCMIFFLTRSGWNVAVRRIAESAAATLPVFALLFIPVLLGKEHIYHWMVPGAADHDPLLQWKQGYLNVGFFLARAGVYFLIWTALSLTFRGLSVRQDTSGDNTITRRLQALAAPGIALGALSITFATFDWNMSIDYHWFSTMYGVIYFAGSFMSLFALLAIVTTLFRSQGLTKNYISVEHQHGIGKMMFGMNCFWAYTSFSQFMLIWYADIPEETIWYLHRWEGSWRAVSILLVVGHFVLPFFFLMSRHIKRNPVTLVLGAVWLLGMHYLDLFWMIMPNVYHGNASFGLSEILSFVGVGGVFVGAFTFLLSRAPLIPVKDPRLPESLAFEN